MQEKLIVTFPWELREWLRVCVWMGWIKGDVKRLSGWLMDVTQVS